MPTDIFSWQGGKYISVDGIFCEVVHRRGNIWKAKKVNQPEEFYICFDGNSKYAHGKTIAEAMEALAYKLGNDANIEKYKGLDLDSEMPFPDAIQCYRVITKACEFGVRSFVKERGIVSRPYTVHEMIGITRGQYGANTFEQFFTKTTGNF